jgi:hypothetical protein
MFNPPVEKLDGDTDEPKPRARRWGLRFSMRSLLIAVTVFCVALGWRLHRAKQQSEAVEAIKDAGGWVYYDYQKYDPNTGEFDAQAQPWEPAWLRGSVGIDFWHDAIGLNMQEGNTRWEHEQTPVNISAHLAHLPRLKFLALTKHTVDDAGMHYVSGLKELEELFYWDALGITDVGATHLRGMPRLRYLFMEATDIGDAGLQSLAKLEGLEALVLPQGNNITDEGLASLAGHPRLKKLWVGGDQRRPSKITSAGVVHLAKIPNLEELELQYSQVTVQGLDPLHALANLKTLVLNGSQADDLDAVSALFPKCRIGASKK